ncbi:class E sortase [Kitasatospora sp. NPDC086791]|uniref:class E sortase n=1 Tax=Kitasatospora sp. NPDC086791 TaxID=3155178 RepID=UPI00343262C6
MPATAVSAHGCRPVRQPARDVAHALLAGTAELILTIGLLVCLFVAYELWWTDLRAHHAQLDTTGRLLRQWERQPHTDDGGIASVVPWSRAAPGDAVGILYIPRLGKDWSGVIAEGIGRDDVLNRGLIGHYRVNPSSAEPGQEGNVALAAHSITYGAPFADLDLLRVGDHLYVETAGSWYTYTIDAGPYLTDPSSVGVVAPIPEHSGFTAPGRYVTLTTCWPPVTSAKRMIYWGHQIAWQPRRDGMSGPDRRM